MQSLSRFQAVNVPSKPLLKLSEVEQEEIWVRVGDRVEDIFAVDEWDVGAGEGRQEDVGLAQVVEQRVEDSHEDFVEDLGNGVGLEMVAVPAGAFWMGSPDREVDRKEREGPQHRVTVSEFYLGKFPVTQAQWMEVAGLPKVEVDLKPQPSYFLGLDRPVETINWFEAVEFCARLSRQTRRVYRLPSEAEWEYACRARTVTPFSFGETISTDLANYDGNYVYGNGSKGKYRGETTSVGIFKANDFGLYDMHGNVWEWCEDVWHENYTGAPPGGTPWIEGGSKKPGVARWFVV